MSASKPRSFLAELKRRNVLRAGALYIGAAWALSQGVAQLLPVFDIPNWVVRWFVIAAVIGFPFAMLFSWFYEWTPQGIVRESEVAPDESVTRETGRKLDRWIIAVLSIAVVLLLADVFVPHRDAGSNAAGGSTDKSIAVLPFVNMSGDPKNDYFSDGITEEILNALAQVPGLKVAARTSAFAFKGKDQDLRKVGQALDVATVLEGSVQRQGDDVRITAQLIDAHNGYHLWSQTYDRKLTSIFAVEDEISGAIAGKLQAQLAGGSRPIAGTHDPRAHELYLRGLTLLAARGAGLRDAADAFRQAIAIDPNYAQAWAALAQAEVLVHNWHFDSEGTAMRAADSAVKRALELDPDNATAHVALGILHDERWEWPDADHEFRRALELAPGDAEALDQYAQFLHDTGNMQEALPVIERANRLDPLSGVIGGVHALVLMDLRRLAPARTQVDRTLAVAPASRFAHGVSLILALASKDYPEAEAEA
ncbi:MAG TPA: tetratricopeptide repeat protein, partial [Xanthomonadaceae bacterium]|nr:tetratricopeptide repeat protein [Xanthomonadaceae bacterium]